MLCLLYIYIYIYIYKMIQHLRCGATLRFGAVCPSSGPLVEWRDQHIADNLCRALCLHFNAMSDRLFTHLLLFMFLQMWSFSVRQRSHKRLPLLYTGAWLRISQVIGGVGLSPFSQT